MSRLEVIPLRGVGEVGAGTDLAALLLDACATTGVTLRDGDVMCVAQKVVSKAEGRLRRLPPGADPHATRRQIAREQAVRVVVDSPQVLVVETPHGFVCANAGVDASNLPAGTVALLPEDPDASAARLRAAVRRRAGVDIGVVVTDTFGRPWRLGLTDVAIGCAGIAPLRDERGTTDRSGQVLETTVVAVADELAATADLARHGKAGGAPFVLVRGAAAAGEGAARELVRPAAEDLFRVGGPHPVVQALRLPPPPQRFDPRPVPAEVLQAGRDAARHAATPPLRTERVAPADLPPAATPPVADDAPLLLRLQAGGHDRVAWAAAGAGLHALRVALAAHGVASVWLPPGPAGGRTTGTGAEDRPEPAAAAAMGVLAAGFPASPVSG